MSDQDVNRWSQRGRLYLWRYVEDTRNFGGWHMTADDVACGALLELIDAMRTVCWPTTRTLKVSRPTPRVLAVPNYRGGQARWKAPASLKLSYRTADVEPEHWSICGVGEVVILMVGEAMLAALRQGITDIQAGEGDYCIGNDNDCLWFWWMVG